MSYLFAYANGVDLITFGTGAIPTTGTILICFKTSADFAAATGLASFFAEEEGSQFRVYVDNGSWKVGWITSSTDYRVITTSGFPSPSGPWTRLIFTWDDTANESKLYISGSQVGSTVSTLVTFATTQLQGIGLGSSQWFSPGSRVAHVAIWNAVISGSDITALSAGTKTPATVSVGNRVHYWPLTADATDSWGSANGTVTGATLDGDNPSMSDAAGIVRQMMMHHG